MCTKIITFAAEMKPQFDRTLPHIMRLHCHNQLVCSALLLILAVGLGTPAAAQNRTYKKRGNTEIIGDKNVSQLVDRHIEFNERVRTIPGFRIQIASLSGPNSRTEAFKRKEAFKSQYPDVDVRIVFTEPNFKVLVGDFITRLDAYRFLQHCKGSFPGTIVKDDIVPIHTDYDLLVPESEDDDID